METLLEVEPEIVCCDMHPKYNSVMVAEELGLPVVKVQHHYAHILSCMAENDCAEQVIGVSLMEPDMELTVRSGEEKSCYQI